MREKRETKTERGRERKERERERPRQQAERPAWCWDAVASAPSVAEFDLSSEAFDLGSGFEPVCMFGV